ncbi:MAG TPA: hypothetical protein VFT70_01060 [Nocardioides sp.]|nr:hypothetical protein [Nocardioides sp.]
MRQTIAVPMAALATLAALLSGCGDDTGDTTAGDPTAPASTAGTPSPSTEPVSVRKTCAELYRPPGQLMPRAIELVHGSPSAEDTAKADDLVAGLAAAEAQAAETLAVDIVTTREGVEARVGGEQPVLAEFDQAVNRLGHHCELYND